MKHRKKVGLALGSGGPRGLAHIGVIKTLLAHDIPIDMIAGSSAGALVGGLYLGLKDIEKIESLVLSLGYADLAKIFFDPIFSSGVIKADKTLQFLETHLDGITIESLDRPFIAVASDVVSGKPILLKKGNLATNIMASCSFPIVFSPMEINGHYVIDGGTSIPVPAQVVRSMGADIVIAVNLDAHFFPKADPSKEKKPSVVDVFWSTVNLLRYHLAKENIKAADIVLEPNVTGASVMKFIHGEPMIKKGVMITEHMIPQIKALLAQ